MPPVWDAANTDLEGTAALCEEYGIVAKAALAQKALPSATSSLRPVMR